MSGFEALLTGYTLAERYHIEEVIGRGGMAAVYRARDKRLDREVAVKVISAPAADREERMRLRARFHREARAAASIHHPNVAAVHDYGTDPELDLDFLVMELLRGEDLAQRLRAERPPLHTSVRILRDAARGLAAGHRLGMVHRDVKPGNLFLSRRDEDDDELRVVVLDFGIARLAAPDHTLTQLTMEGGGPLSPAYASPEQLRGETELTPASDVYSLGVVGFELLTGERLFDTMRGGRRSVDEATPLPSLRALDPAIPHLLEWIIQHALAHDPAERFPDASALADALEEAARALTGPEPALPDLAPPLPAPQAAAEPAPRHQPTGRREARRAPPAWIPVLLLLLLVAGGLAVWWMLGGDEPGDRVRGGPPPAEVPDAVGRSAEPARGSQAAPPPATTPARSPAATPGAAAPRPPAAEYNRNGVRYFNLGRLAEARERFRQATELEPQNAEYRNNYGWVLFRLGELEAARRELERVIELEPDRAIAYANLGDVREAQGDTAAAMAMYERFLELNRDPRRQRIAQEKLRSLQSRR